MQDHIYVKGARENNLKNVDVTIPRDKLVVLTGLSGSGKSSLAFDTIYAEGQRRYVESLSSYARMFLGQMEKPDVDYIDGLSPAISIDQKTTSKNPRSTVGTVTEIHDYLRLLYARVGIAHCPKCGREIRRQTVDQMVDQMLALPERTRLQLLAPIVRGKKGEHVKVLESIAKQGFVRVRVDGQVCDVAEAPALAKQKKHTIEVVVDRLILREDIRSRLTDSLETALALSGGIVVADIGPGEREMLFSQNLACPDCGISIEELTPRSFSFNSPFGACPTCAGLGVQMKIDPDLIVPDWTKSLRENPFAVMGWSNLDPSTQAGMFFQALSEKYGFSLDTPLCDLKKEALDVVLYGTKGEPLKIHYTRPNGDEHTFSAPFEGIIPSTERRAAETQSDATKAYYESLMSQTPCPDCRGRRLRPEILAVTVGGKSIADVSDLSVREARRFFSSLSFGEKDTMISEPILKEILARLHFLSDVGLDYLTLSRAAGTLSGGEAQRIRLATQIGSSLVGVLYILDEPSIGLHQRDNAQLIATLKPVSYTHLLYIARGLGRLAVDRHAAALAGLLRHRAAFDDTGYFQIFIQPHRSSSFLFLSVPSGLLPGVFFLLRFFLPRRHDRQRAYKRIDIAPGHHRAEQKRSPEQHRQKHHGKAPPRAPVSLAQHKIEHCPHDQPHVERPADHGDLHGALRAETPAQGGQHAREKAGACDALALIPAVVILVRDAHLQIIPRYPVFAVGVKKRIGEHEHRIEIGLGAFGSHREIDAQIARQILHQPAGIKLKLHGVGNRGIIQPPRLARHQFIHGLDLLLRQPVRIQIAGPRQLLNRPGEHFAGIARLRARRRAQHGIRAAGESGCQQHEPGQPAAPPAQKEGQKRGPNQHGVKHVVAQEHGACRRRHDARAEPASAMRRVGRFQGERQQQRKASGKEHILGCVDGHHHVQRVKRKAQRRPEGASAPAPAGDGGARSRETQRQKRHLHKRIERSPGIDAAEGPPQRHASPQQKRVHKGMMRGIRAGEYLLELKRDIVCKRARKRDQEHRHIACKNQAKRPPCAKCLLILQRHGPGFSPRAL